MTVIRAIFQFFVAIVLILNSVTFGTTDKLCSFLAALSAAIFMAVGVLTLIEKRTDV